MISKKKFNIITDEYAGERGSFFYADTVNESVEVHSCRESFHDEIDGSEPRFIGFGIDGLNVNRLAKFLAELEKKLGIAESTIHQIVDESFWVAIKINPWWNENRLRQEVLTVLLRAAHKGYDGRSFWSFLKESVAARTERSLRLFIEEGFTNPRSPSEGWDAQFVDSTSWKDRHHLVAEVMEKP